MHNITTYLKVGTMKLCPDLRLMEVIMLYNSRLDRIDENKIYVGEVTYLCFEAIEYEERAGSGRCLICDCRGYVGNDARWCGRCLHSPVDHES